MTDWLSLREQLKARCGGYCEGCGWPLPITEWATHHRRLRSHGGGHVLDNLVALHHHCHNISPGSVHETPQEARRRGLIVPMDVEPHLVPLRLPDGSWMHLGEVYEPCTDKEHECWFPPQ